MKPMGLMHSLLFFCIPGFVIFALFYGVYPKLIDAGVSVHWATYLCLWTPLILMVLFVAVGFFRSRMRVSEYFWMGKINLKQLMLILLSLLAVLVLEASLDFTRHLLVKLPGFHVPSHYPDLFRVDTEFTIPMETFLGMSLSGNVFPLVFFGIWLFTNIFCEEVLWRGYALPRMEKVFGKWAWVINGILWNVAIHFFFRWSFIVLIPISMVVPYLCQRYKSMIPGVIIHGGGNLLIYALLIPSYFS